MRRHHLLIIAAIFLVVAASFAYLLITRSIEPTIMSSGSESENVVVDDSALGSDRVRGGDRHQSSDSSGSYVDYSSEAVSSTKGTRLLFFHAPWCPQCRALEKSIEVGPIPEDVTIFKVDYDSNHQLRQKYEVTIQTTVVLIDDEGERIESFVAYDDPSLEAVKRELLQ